jgi:hypothetical protein
MMDAGCKISDAIFDKWLATAYFLLFDRPAKRMVESRRVLADIGGIIQSRRENSFRP